MSLKQLIAPFPWTVYSKKLVGKIERPKSVGHFSEAESEERKMRLASGTGGNRADGNFVKLDWLVDKEDGMIVDARFEVFGQSALIGAAEAACELLIGKNYDQALRISAELIDKQVRDKTDQPAFPRETAPHINLVLEAIETCASKCTDIPFSEDYVSMPTPSNFEEVMKGTGYPGWMELPLKKKLAVIEEVLDRDIRPYISLDGGGVEVLNLLEDKDVIITYQGTCTSCYSAVGTTLSYIQQVLRAQVHPAINVVPEFGPMENG